MNSIQEHGHCTKFVHRRPTERVNVHFLQLSIVLTANVLIPDLISLVYKMYSLMYSSK